MIPMIIEQTTKLAFLENVKEFENELKKHEQIEMTPIHHFFISGAYIRELLIPAGTMLVGRKHATEHVSIMLSGEMTVLSEGGAKRIKAPYVHVGAPGTKRVGYAHQDSKWITVHITGNTDLSEIEKEEFEDEISMFDFASGVAIDNQITAARKDFENVLEESGFTADQARHETEIEEDRIDIDLDEIGLSIRTSPIEGVGVFVVNNIGKDELIGPARMDGMRTQLGRYINHSPIPNAVIRQVHDDLYVVALSGIIAGEEITIDYRIPLEFRLQGGKTDE